MLPSMIPCTQIIHQMIKIHHRKKILCPTFDGMGTSPLILASIIQKYIFYPILWFSLYTKLKPSSHYIPESTPFSSSTTISPTTIPTTISTKSVESYDLREIARNDTNNEEYDECIKSNAKKNADSNAANGILLKKRKKNP